MLGERLVRQAGHETTEQEVDRLVVECLELDGGEAPHPRAPGRMTIRDLRPREREHEEREPARPLEQVLEELDQGSVGPLDVLEDHDHRVLLGHSLDEEPPPREEVVAIGSGAVCQPEQVLEARLDEAPVCLVGDDLLEDDGELRECVHLGLILGDPGAHADHLRQCPVRDAFAVGQAAPLVPPRVVREPVDVLLELPGKA